MLALARTPYFPHGARLPKAPSWLSKLAKEEWKRVAPALFKRGALTPEIQGSLENYCDAQGTVRECAAQIAEEGRTISGVHGMRRAHPLLASKAQAQATAGALAKKMGLFNEFAQAMSDDYADLGVR